ncbi:hypothetical protein CEK26_000197 [Fusarium fujikuroi]|uniref:Uncharacterized protein n=1 Tax=Fusarium fujikuroi TaxID=5127 RepID=A0A5Q3E826_FUSFU|nr:hypothetical protein CEK27_000194 [Fusarium fujikuroi]QGI75287.1 hypothetical protein CEK25_000193 [Fusarium fujikuroi]QGI88982.1 hypothetical protein CEK26_000197 [Fusarium fujikuroi]VTT62417.1 unnamed protein product [Fusarium fujikuroi]VTT75056.1 unnamed protein product [Fusarium fujikuroi]
MPDGRDLEVKLEQEETVPSWDDEDQRVDADFRSVAGKMQLPKLVRINGRNVRQTRSNDRRGPDAGLVQLHAYTYNRASLYSKVQTKRIQTLKYGNRSLKHKHELSMSSPNERSNYYAFFTDRCAWNACDSDMRGVAGQAQA